MCRTMNQLKVGTDSEGLNALFAFDEHVSVFSLLDHRKWVVTLQR